MVTTVKPGENASFLHNSCNNRKTKEQLKVTRKMAGNKKSLRKHNENQLIDYTPLQKKE